MYEKIEYKEIVFLEWIKSNKVEDNMIFKKAYQEQITFVQELMYMIVKNIQKFYKENDFSFIKVINTHMSKSIRLPVYEINLKKYNTKLIMRNNFYDWRISVISKIDIKDNFLGLFDMDKQIPFCEGFDNKDVYPPYSINHKKFTLELNNDYELYTFVFILINYLKSNFK